MKQAFGVWYANKENILYDVLQGVHHGENYKLARPQQLYHLDLHQNSAQSGDLPEHAANYTDHENLTHATAESDTVALHLQALSVGHKNDTSGTTHAPQQERPSISHVPSQLSVFSAKHADALVLLKPEDIHWVYLDASGNEQGPFSGDVMQEWLADGYLSADLKIRRHELSKFVTLHQFCESIDNLVLPFKTPLPPVHEPAVTSVSQHPAASGPFSFAANLDPVSAQATGVSLESSGLFGTAQATVGTVQSQSQGSFNLKLYPQILPHGGFGGGGLRSLSCSMFDYGAANDYSIMSPLFSAGSQFGLDKLNQNIGGGFGQLHMPSLLHQQIHGQQPILSRNNSGWAVDASIPSPIPLVPGAGAPAPLNMALAALGGTSLLQSSPMSPWLNRVSSSRATSPFVPGASLKNKEPVLSDLHSSMVTGILNDEELSLGFFQQRTTTENEPMVTSKTQEIPSAPVAPAVAPNFASKPARASAPARAAKTDENRLAAAARGSAKKDTRAVPEKALKPQTAVVNGFPASAKAPAFSEPEKVQKVMKTAEVPVHAPAKPTAVAPWAKEVPEQMAPAVTLKEIQRMEAEGQEKEKQGKREREMALAEAKHDEKVAEIERVPSFNWAHSWKKNVAKQTLAEIQKEEEEAARAKAQKKGAVGASLASTLASAVPKDDFGRSWTTVTKKPVVNKVAPLAIGPVVQSLQSVGTINPQILRSASSHGVSAVSINANALKEDFLVWARTAMTNLYPSVSKDDLLEVFTTLPIHGDSQQLISETIYNSSATMDGRRFAQEFMKKRQQVERQIGANMIGSWSGAIASSADKTPAVNDDGWSTSVKSKKKGKVQ